MESIIQFLLTRKPEDSPKSMQGEVSSNSSSISALPMYQYLQYIYRFAESGGDTCSNTTTRLVYWMCNRQHFSMNQEAGNGSAKDLGAFAYNLATIPYKQTTLFVLLMFYLLYWQTHPVAKLPSDQTTSDQSGQRAELTHSLSDEKRSTQSMKNMLLV